MQLEQEKLARPQGLEVCPASRLPEIYLIDLRQCGQKSEPVVVRDANIKVHHWCPFMPLSEIDRIVGPAGPGQDDPHAASEVGSPARRFLSVRARETGRHGFRAADQTHGCRNPGRYRSGGRRRRHDGFWLWETVYGPEPAEEPLPVTVKGMGIEVGIKARLRIRHRSEMPS